MRPILIIAVVAACFILVEGQSGASAPQLAPEFNRVHEIRCAEPERGLRSIRIMTWNIHHGADAGRLSAEMARNPADLWLLQEVDWNTARAGEKDVASELAERLHLNGSFGVEFEELSQERKRPAYTGQAILTRLPIRNSRVLRFARQSGFWKPHGWIPSNLPFMQRRLGNRIALVMELEFDGRLLVVYNAHLESRSAGAIQSQQIDEMVRDAKQYPPGTAVILGGDLNTKYLPSIFLHKLERDGFVSATGEHIQRTHRIAMALDWIFVKGPVQLGGGAVRRDIAGSDHYPVHVTLTAK